MINILSDDFTTELGIIRTWLETEEEQFMLQREGFTCATIGHSIYLQPFDLEQILQLGTTECESARGWRWFIQKTNDKAEQLYIYCKLINPSKELSWGSNAGEHLDSIEIESKTHHLHIGTEDGERMQSRAEESDWMPERFKDKLGWSESFTEYTDYGFRTTVPSSKQGEKIYFHYLLATNPIKMSEEHLSERNAYTWYAVDKLKEQLDMKLKYGR